MRVNPLAIVKNLLGDTIRICMGEDGEYYLQDGYKLYKMKYNNDDDDGKFDPIDFLNKATYKDEATLTYNQLIHIITNIPALNNRNPVEQPA